MWPGRSAREGPVHTAAPMIGNRFRGKHHKDFGMGELLDGGVIWMGSGYEKQNDTSHALARLVSFGRPAGHRTLIGGGGN